MEFEYKKGGRIAACPPPLTIQCFVSRNDPFIKFDCGSKVILVWPSFGDAADQLEGAESIKSKASVFTADLRSFTADRFRDCLRIAFFLRTVGIDEKDFFPCRQIALRKLQNALMELGVINTRGKADKIVCLEISCRRFYGVN